MWMVGVAGLPGGVDSQTAVPFHQVTDDAEGSAAGLVIAASRIIYGIRIAAARKWPDLEFFP